MTAMNIIVLVLYVLAWVMAVMTGTALDPIFLTLMVLATPPALGTFIP